jgi:excisionase family DNA binding protein
MDNSEGPRLLKPPDAAKRLGISERKLWDLAKRGEVPVVRIGRSVRYDVADLQRWIDSCKQSGHNGPACQCSVAGE